MILRDHSRCVLCDRQADPGERNDLFNEFSRDEPAKVKERAAMISNREKRLANPIAVEPARKQL